jgi:cation diffusion facilitator family transporter
VADGTRARVLTQAAGAPRASVRTQAVTRVLVRVLFLNLGVAAAKLVLGYATGAVSVVSDGFHSLTDSGSNVMALAGLRASRMPPDIDHPYGHRKYETLAAAGIFIFLLLAVLEIGRVSLKRLGDPSPPQVTALSFVVMIATLLINVWVVRYEAGEGRRLHSELLLADSMHTKSDVYATVGVLVSLTAVWLGFPLLDPIGGIVIAVLIAYTGYQIARESSRILSDRVVIDEEDVRRVVMSVPEVIGCHQIRSRGSSDHAFLDLHIWLPATLPLRQAHHLSHVVKDRLTEKYPQIADAIIHIEPPPEER